VSERRGKACQRGEEGGEEKPRKGNLGRRERVQMQWNTAEGRGGGGRTSADPEGD
jgi:hypothetical protein